MTPSPHVFHIGQATPQFSNEYGWRTSVTRKDFPILHGMSMYHLMIKPSAFREPHWHANAHELAYCTQGEALVTVFSNGNVHDSFTIQQDEMFFVPSGYLHSIENTGKTNAEFIIAFSHHEPEDFGISGAVGCMNANIMGNTWGLPENATQGLRYDPKDIVMARKEGAAQIPHAAGFGNHYKMSVKGLPALVNTDYGSATTIRKQFWPILDGLAMYVLKLKGTGMREPHWHPQTAEMGYVVAGKARMTILNPGGQVDTYTLNAGDMYFIPKSYPHHIENLTNDEMRFLIFFDQDMPQDIGFTGALAAYPRGMIAPTLGCTEKALPQIPDRPSDLFIVQKVNPVLK